MKAGLVKRAEEYPWSSAKAHLMGTDDSLLSEISWLGSGDLESYVNFVKDVDTETDNAIRRATATGRPFGSEIFIGEMELRLGKSLRPKKPGRPPKK